MSFREKSAWGMGAVMLITGLLYFQIALGHSQPGSTDIHDLAHWVILVIILSIAVQVVLAILSRKEARQPADERERLAIYRAGNWSGVVMAVCAVSAALNYFVHGNGDILFHGVIGSLIAAQFADYAFQILFFRRGA